MSRGVSGILTSVITVGLIGLLIYYCCLRSRRRTAGTVHVTTLPHPPPPVFANNPAVPPAQGYPYYPSSQQPHLQQYNQYPTPANGSTAQYPNTGYPANPNQQPSYPMPMPQPYEPTVATHQQSPNPYGYNPTAPPSGYPGPNDLPPPYSQVVPER